MGYVGGQGGYPPHGLGAPVQQQQEAGSQTALASGYRTNSKKFVKVVRIQLRKMATVERVPDKGYRLQKT